jgi:hypothetical protein
MKDPLAMIMSCCEKPTLNETAKYWGSLASARSRQMLNFRLAGMQAKTQHQKKVLKKYLQLRVSGRTL